MPAFGAPRLASITTGDQFGKATFVVQELTAAMEKFTEALSPGTMLEFDRACRDLMATIGSALQPVFEVFTGVLRDVAGQIQPAMAALRPVFETLAEIVGTALKGAAMQLATVFEALAPLIGFTLSIFQDIQQVCLAVVTIFRTLAQTLFAWIGSMVSLKPIMEEFQSITKTVIKYLYLFAAGLARFFGNEGFISTLIENIKPKQGLAAAPTTSSIKSFESISKELATSAFIASGTGQQADKFDLGDVVARLEEFQAGNEGWPHELIELLHDIRKFLENPGKGVQEGSEKIGNWAGNLLEKSGFGVLDLRRYK